MEDILVKEVKEVKIEMSESEKKEKIMKDLSDIYGSDTKLDEFKIDVNSKYLVIIREILKISPSTFQDIIGIIDKSIKDGRFDILDTPYIVLALTNFYKKEMKLLKFSVKVGEFLEFVEFLLNTLVKIKYMNLDDQDEKQFIKTLRASLDLLELVVPESVENMDINLKSCCSCFSM